MAKSGLRRFADASKVILKEEKQMRWDVSGIYDKSSERIDRIVRLREIGMLGYRNAVHEILSEVNHAMNYSESYESEKENAN